MTSQPQLIIPAPSTVVEVHSGKEFNETLEKYATQMIILSFYTETCSVCKSFAPHYARTQQEFQRKGVIFARINANAHPLIAQQFNVMGVPFTIFIKGKEVISSFSGGKTPPQFRSMVKELLRQHFGVKSSFSPDSFESIYM